MQFHLLYHAGNWSGQYLEMAIKCGISILCSLGEHHEHTEAQGLLAAAAASHPVHSCLLMSIPCFLWRLLVIEQVRLQAGRFLLEAEI